MRRAIEDLGFLALRFADDLGKLALFTLRILAARFTPPLRCGAFVTELFKLGVLSLIIICVSGIGKCLMAGISRHTASGSSTVTMYMPWAW